MNSVSPETPASILVSDDEPLVRTYLSDVLGQSGFRVIVAANGDVALAKRENVCVVITAMSPCRAPSMASRRSCASCASAQQRFSARYASIGQIRVPGWFWPVQPTRSASRRLFTGSPARINAGGGERLTDTRMLCSASSSRTSSPPSREPGCTYSANRASARTTRRSALR